MIIASSCERTNKGFIFGGGSFKYQSTSKIFLLEINKGMELEEEVK